MSLVCLPNVVYAAVNLTVTTAADGATIAANTMAMGNVNALGIGVPPAGITIVAAGVTNRVLYTSPYDLNLTLTGGSRNKNITITAIAGNFTQATTMFLVSSCSPGAGCTNGANYTQIPTAGSITVVPSTLVATTATFTPSIALVALVNNGAGSFAGADSVTVTFTATASNGNTGTRTLTLTSTFQTAVQLTLGTAPGGLSVTPASDYAANFGNVNGLGIGTPTAGLTKTSIAGGYIYSTPYSITPTFADFTSTTGNVTVYVSTDFVHPSTLNLRDAATCCASFAPISKVAGAPTTITAAAASTTAITRYLGLFVSSANGGGAFPGTAAASGSDSAKLTFTLTVP